MQTLAWVYETAKVRFASEIRQVILYRLIGPWTKVHNALLRVKMSSFDCAKHTKDSSFRQIIQCYKILHCRFRHIENRSLIQSVFPHIGPANNYIQSSKDHLQLVDFQCTHPLFPVHIPKIVVLSDLISDIATLNMLTNLRDYLFTLFVLFCFDIFNVALSGIFYTPIGVHLP